MSEPRKIDRAELFNRFDYHPPIAPGRAKEHELVRLACFELAELLTTLLPPGREASLAVTHLEEAMFWANASLARQP